MCWELILSRLIIENQMTRSVVFPAFKFYDSLCLQLLGFARKYGSEIREHCSFIREQIALDFQFQQKVLSSFWRVLAEFLIMSVLTWGFHFSIIHYLELSASQNYLIIIGLELVGFFLFILLFYVVAIKGLQKFEKYFKSLIFLKSLLGAHLPFQQICQLSSVNEVLESSERIDDIHQGLSGLVKQMLVKGSSGVSDKLSLLIKELHYRQKLEFDSVQKRISIIKMILILFLFFPAYLLNIWEIIGNMSF